MKILARAMGVGCSSKNGAPVIVQYLEPSLDIGGVIDIAVRVKTEICAQKRSPKFGDQFLSCISLVSPTSLTEIAIEPDAEITLEANPDDLTKEKCADLKRAGINRLSIGIQ